jgi:DNA-binding transcriptional regulator LsrR (DeoR family)
MTVSADSPRAVTKASRGISKAERMNRAEEKRALITFMSVEWGVEDCDIPRELMNVFGIKVDKSTVSRALKTAARRQWIQKSLSDAFDQDRLRGLREFAPILGGLRTRLMEESEGRLAALHIFWSGSDDNWDARVRTFSGAAAPTLLDLIDRSRHLGLSWGGTLGACVETLAPAGAQRPKLQVTPACGEPLGPAGSAEASSTMLTERLCQILGARPGPSLRGIPPMIPAGHDREQALRLFRLFRPYSEIFGSKKRGAPPALVKTIDTFLTSCGNVGEGYHAFQSQFIDAAIKRRELEKLALGDIAGLLIARNGLSSRERHRLQALRDRWTGITLADLRRISRGAPAAGSGVIVCAVGAWKADMVHALVTRERLVNHLLVDHTLAGELARKLKVPMTRALA